MPLRPRTEASRLSPVAVRLPAAVLSLIVLLLLGASSLPSSGGSPAGQIASRTLAPTGGVSLAGTAALRVTTLGEPLGGSGPAPAVAAGPTANCTWSGLQLSWTVTSGAQNGPAPLSLNWTVHVIGGTAPYNISTNTSDGTTLYGAVVHHTWVLPGIYQVQIWAADSGSPCLAAGTGFQVSAWGSGGPDPATFSVNTTSGPTPLHVHYGLQLAGAPSNLTVEWWCLQSDGFGVEYQQGAAANCTFYDPGSSSVYVFAEYPDGVAFWTGSGPSVNGTGAPVLTLQGGPLSGRAPVSGSYWVNATNRSLLPSGASAQSELVTGGSCVPNTTANTSVGLGVSESFGPLTYRPCAVDTFGTADYYLTATVTDGNGTVVWTAELFIGVGPSTGSNPFPQLSLSISPSNGTSPLNVTFTATAMGGVPAYTLRIGLQGAGTALPNGSRLPLFFANVSGWNGSTIGLTHTFTGAGSYPLVAEVVDSLGTASWALGSVTVVTALTPPPLTIATWSGPVSGGTPTIVNLLVNVSGGAPPYSVEWSYGDGTVGSSVPGVPLTHTFDQSGTYSVTVRVIDRNGMQASERFSVTVPSPLAPSASPASPPWAILVLAVAAFLVGAVVVEGLRRRRSRRQAEEGTALVARLGESSSGFEESAGP